MLNKGDYVSLEKDNNIILKGEIVSLNNQVIIVHPTEEHNDDYLAAKIITKNNEGYILKSNRVPFKIEKVTVNKNIYSSIFDKYISESRIPDYFIDNWDFDAREKEYEIIDDFEEIENDEWYSVQVVYDDYETDISISKV